MEKQAIFSLLGRLGRSGAARMAGAGLFGAAHNPNLGRNGFMAAQNLMALGKAHGLPPEMVSSLASGFAKNMISPGPGLGTRLIEHGAKEVFGTIGGIVRDSHKLHLERALAPKAMNPWLGLAGNVAVAGGIAGAVALGGAAQNALRLNASYSKMLQLYPELAREQPDRVKGYFDTIASASPDTAAQPMIVGSLIKRMLNFDGFDPATYNQLVSTQASFSKIQGGGADHFGASLDALHSHGIGIPSRH